MTEKIKYFALVLNTRTVKNPHSVLREVRSDDDYRTDIWDRSLRAWRLQMSLAAYIIDGEIGVVDLTEAEANRIINARKGEA